LAQAALLHLKADQLLARLNAAGCQQIILSNYLIDAIKRELRRLNIDTLINAVLAFEAPTAEAYKESKGDKLKRYMKENDLSPENTVIVGDTPEEIRIARDLGALSVALLGGYASEKRLHAEKPDHIIAEFAMLRPILQERGFLS
jgi:phosphoglycolate phosphatase